MKNITLLDLVNWLTAAVTIGSLIRVGLYRLPDLLRIFVRADSTFWLHYAKLVEACDVILGWLTFALAKYGKSDVLTAQHQEWLRDKPPAPTPPAPPIAILDAAKEEPTQPPVH